MGVWSLEDREKFLTPTLLSVVPECPQENRLGAKLQGRERRTQAESRGPSPGLTSLGSRQKPEPGCSAESRARAWEDAPPGSTERAPFFLSGFASLCLGTESPLDFDAGPWPAGSAQSGLLVGWCRPGEWSHCRSNLTRRHLSYTRVPHCVSRCDVRVWRIHDHGRRLRVWSTLPIPAQGTHQRKEYRTRPPRSGCWEVRRGLRL